MSEFCFSWSQTAKYVPLPFLLWPRGLASPLPICFEVTKTDSKTRKRLVLIVTMCRYVSVGLFHTQKETSTGNAHRLKNDAIRARSPSLETESKAAAGSVCFGLESSETQTNFLVAHNRVLSQQAATVLGKGIITIGRFFLFFLSTIRSWTGSLNLACESLKTAVFCGCKIWPKVPSMHSFSLTFLGFNFTVVRLFIIQSSFVCGRGSQTCLTAEISILGQL